VAGQVFRDCDQCPEMVVVPGGSFMMGSPETETGRSSAEERPQHRVTFAQPFAVGKYELTFDEWDACVAAGGCNKSPTTKAGDAADSR
jgi:formylglycine-generating enzyme required for sulfatase activity